MNPNHNTRHQRILIIDDNPAIHDDFRTILCEKEFDSGLRESGSESNDLARAYELVVTLKSECSRPQGEVNHETMEAGV